MDYQSKIIELLLQRAPGKTICPSEVLPIELKHNKELMEEVRAAARVLVAKGKIEITQKGEVINPQTIKGPIRLRLK
ncbi:MAG: DUF3253 domain-containing protein [Bacteriovoracia bacterium]